MNIQDLQKQIFSIILLIINYDKSFDPPSHNDKQIEIEEIAEEVIERISEKYILLKKEN